MSNINFTNSLGLITSFTHNDLDLILTDLGVQNASYAAGQNQITFIMLGAGNLLLMDLNPVFNKRLFELFSFSLSNLFPFQLKLTNNNSSATFSINDALVSVGYSGTTPITSLSQIYMQLYTQSGSNISVYSKSEIDQLILGLIDNAPSNLDTLNEIAQALQSVASNDQNLAASLLLQIQAKLNINNPNFTGILKNDNFSLDPSGNLICNNATINGIINGLNISSISGLQNSLDSKQQTITTNSLPISATANLQSILNGLQPLITNNSLNISSISGLQNSLDSKQQTLSNNSVPISYVSGLQASLDAKQTTITTNSLNISSISGLQISLDSKQPTITNNSLNISSISGLSASLSTYATQTNLNNSINTLSGQTSISLASKQPLDTTNTLASIPKNLSTITTYFSGFPNDQPSWTSQASATFTNISGNPNMQHLTFLNSDSTLSVSISNTISTSTLCTISVAVKLDTANGFTLAISKNTTPLATQTFNSSTLNNTYFTIISMTFTVASSGNLTLSLLPDSSYDIGSIYTSNWSIYTGLPQSTNIRGNVLVPYGSITTNDLIYGPYESSLVNDMLNMTLATQALAPLNSPQFTGTITGITKNMVGLGNVDNTADSNKVFSENQITNLVSDLASKANQSTTYTKTEIDTTINSLPSKTYVDGSLNTINSKFSNYYNISYVDGSLNTISGKLTTINNSITSLNTSVSNTYSKSYIDGSLNSINNQLNVASIIVNSLGNRVDNLDAEMLLVPTKTYVDASLNNIKSSLTAYAPLNNPQFTGTISGITATMVGLGNINNTSDLNKPISNATQTALNLKAPLNNPQFTGTISSNKFLVDATGNLTAFSLTSNNNLTCTDLLYAGGTSLTSTIGKLAPSINPSISGTLTTDNITTNNIIYSNGTITAASNFAVYGTSLMQGNLTMQSPATIVGISSGTVGLGNVNNTSDVNKPISTATQTALNLKANLDSPNFTGTLAIKNGTNSVFSVDNYANITCNGIGSFSIMNGATPNFYVDYSGNITTQGLLQTSGGISTPSITLNGSSISSQFASKSSGSITATTTFQTIYTLTSGTQGVITAVSGNGSYPCMMSAFFQWTNGTTYPSLTQIASSGNAVQSGISTTNVGNGTQYIALQITSTGTPLIQIKSTTSSFTVRWYITLL